MTRELVAVRRRIRGEERDLAMPRFINSTTDWNGGRIQKTPMLVALKASIAALIFAIGMSATMSDVAYIWRRPVLLGKSLLAMYVIVPLSAALMARGLALPWGTEVALMVLAICAGAPLLPKKLVKLGGDSPPTSSASSSPPRFWPSSPFPQAFTS